MSYTNTVGIIPGGATEKLPFIHSDFKARSKIGRCIAGFRKHTSRRNHDSGVPTATKGGYSHGMETQPKLPQIYYSAGDQKNVITCGSPPRRGRPEYPGFVGNKKVLKKKDNYNYFNTIQTSNYGCNNIAGAGTYVGSGSWAQQSNSTMKSYLSLPNLNSLHKQGMKVNGLAGMHTRRSESKERHHQSGYSFIDDYYDEDRLINYVEGQQIESLIFVDEDNERQPQQSCNHEGFGNITNYDCDHNTSRVKVKDRSSSYYDMLCQQSSPVRNPTTPAEMDSFAKGVDEKLREDKGKSGMKRERPRHRRDSDHVRILGDVVTAERMHELLKPRKDGEELNFT